MKKLILLKPYGVLPKGAEMHVTAAIASELIKRGVARSIDEQEKKSKHESRPARRGKG